MFGLFSKKKKIELFDFASLKTDMHSHLLPGIDDGSPDLETSIGLIKGFSELGYKKIITTPHVLWDMYKNTPEIIKEKLETVREALKENNIDIELKAAAEYFLDDHAAKLIQKKEPLLTLKDNLVLVEFSVTYMSINMKEVLFDMQMAGYLPVIAHPERYIYLNNNRQIFEELIAAGCLFQLNILSLTGGYGKIVTELAQHLIKNDFYSLIGTDLHHEGHLERLKNLKPLPELEKLLNSANLLNAQL